VVVERENLRNWPGGAADITALQGRQIRIRGWLKDWNGPMIEATHPQQIEFLRPAAAPVRRS
jgi:micrococcal nuclease